MASEQDSDRRRRQREDQEASPLFVLPQPNPPQAEPLPGERAGSAFSSRRWRARIASADRMASARTARGVSDTSSSLAELQHAGRQLEQASSNLRALLDEPFPNLPTPVLEPTDGSPEAEHNRRAKRRKVELDRLDSGFNGFSYGRYGQVEPGKLKMEIVSCDGGIYSEGNYAAENILKNDSTVYCTKSNRCNLVLRHQGSTVFSLKELVIKAPHSGYTAP